MLLLCISKKTLGWKSIPKLIFPDRNAFRLKKKMFFILLDFCYFSGNSTFKTEGVKNLKLKVKIETKHENKKLLCFTTLLQSLREKL